MWIEQDKEEMLIVMYKWEVWLLLRIYIKEMWMAQFMYYGDYEEELRKGFED